MAYLLLGDAIIRLNMRKNDYSKIIIECVYIKICFGVLSNIYDNDYQLLMVNKETYDNLSILYIYDFR